MRAILGTALWVVVSGSVANAASYQKYDFSIVDTILYTADAGGGVHPYSGVDLRSYTDLSGAQLGSAYLFQARLEASNLSGAVLDSAYLYDAWLDSANLSDASLVGANLRTAWIDSADLSGADLSDTDLTSVWLGSADLSSANLGGAKLPYAYLGLADLTDADVSDTDFSDTDLTNAMALDSSIGSAFYNANTNFTGTGFDPAAAGWVPEPGPSLAMASSLWVIAGLRRRCASSRHGSPVGLSITPVPGPRARTQLECRRTRNLSLRLDHPKVRLLLTKTASRKVSTFAEYGT